MKKLFARVFTITMLAVFGLGINANAQQVREAQKRAVGQRTVTTEANQGLAPEVIDTIGSDLANRLPIDSVKKSLRNDHGYIPNEITDRIPLAYENLREDDAVYVQRIWRDVDAREKINLPFRYNAVDNQGDHRFISMILQAIQDGPDNGGVTAFDPIDDRFTTPLTIAEVGKKISGEAITIPIYGPNGEIDHYEQKLPEVNLDSFYRYRIKEEVIFDKESSRLVWRIIGIAPLKNVITSEGVNLGEAEMFWVYYPDMRPIFAKYEAYNGKNYGARMSWEELLESRMFHGLIVKSTLNNPFNELIRNQAGFRGNNILQLLESENIKNQVFDYEQNLWSY